MSLHNEVKDLVDDLKISKESINEDINLDVNEEKIASKMKELGLKPDFSIIKQSLVSGINDNKDKMFEEFFELIREFNSDDNVFKYGTLPKDGTKTYPMSILGTVAEIPKIKSIAKEQKVKDRYPFAASFFKNYNIALSSENRKDGNRSTQVKEIMTAFVNFKSLLMYRASGRGGIDDESGENTPSERLKKGFLSRR